MFKRVSLKETPYIISPRPLKGRVELWAFASILVIVFYGLIGWGIIRSIKHDDRLIGAPPAIMLEFAEEPTAPNDYKIADTLQAETQINVTQKIEDNKEELEKKSDSVPEDINSEPIVTPESELFEHVKPPSKQVKSVEKKEETHKDKPRKAKKNVQKGKTNQQAAAPLVDGKVSHTFAAPRNSRSEGAGGMSNSWRAKVQVILQRTANRLGRQAGGLSGITVIHFAFDASGRIQSTQITQSAGDDRIDNLAIRVVKLSTLPPPPEGSGALIVPIRIE